jgi:hypothetical protein
VRVVKRFLLLTTLLLGCAPAGGGPGTGSGGGTAGGAAGAGAGGVGGNAGAGVAGVGPGGSGAGLAPGGTNGGPAGSTGDPGGSTGGPAGSTGGPAGTTGTGGTGGAAPMPSLIGDVKFSTPSQSFRTSIQVGLTTSLTGAEIRYTTDGTLPAATSTLYAGTAITLTATTQLRATPFIGGAPGGRTSTALYIARTFDATSTLPLMILDGYGGGPSTNKDLYLNAAVMIWDPAGGGGSASLTSLPTVVARSAYHLRGQSSASFPQKPYKVEFRDNGDGDMKLPVLGMPAEADWALIAPYYDRALIRNPFIYGLGREMGMLAPRLQYVEVYINTANRPVADTDYQGIYWLTETIENSPVRFNLKQLEEKDTTAPTISGGYIFKFDQAAAEEPKLACTGSNPISGGIGGTGTGGARGTCWVDLEVVDPEPLGPEQKAWLTQYIQEFHNSLHTTPIGSYANWIDVPSFVDNLIINELSRNVDAYVRSSYYHKDRDGKLKGGPLWDYNFSLAVGGMGTVAPAPAMNGFQYQGTRNVNNWYPKLTSDPAFMNMVKARYQALRGNLLSDASIQSRIDALIVPLTPTVVARDYAKWPVTTVLPNGRNGIVYGPSVATWDGQVKAMRDFLTARLAWMDTQLR